MINIEKLADSGYTFILAKGKLLKISSVLTGTYLMLEMKKSKNRV